MPLHSSSLPLQLKNANPFDFKATVKTFPLIFVKLTDYNLYLTFLPFFKSAILISYELYYLTNNYLLQLC